MIRKINSIDKRGKVLFQDDKGTGTTTGTEQDCLSYGFKFRANQCFCFDTIKKPSVDDRQYKGNLITGASSFAIGIGNTIKNGLNNIAIGFGNIMKNNSFNSIAIGKNAYTESFGEIAFSSCNTANKAKYSILQFTGTTTNNTATELYLGGHVGQRLLINESDESAYYIESKCIILDATNNVAAARHSYLVYKYVNNTLTETVDAAFLTIGDSALNAVTIAFAPVASTPDYIEVKATGLAATTIDYNISVNITEVRNG